MLLGNGVDGLAGGKVATNVQFVKNTIPETSNKAKSSKTKCCCSVAQLCLTLCNPMDSSTPGSPVHHHLLGLTQTRVHSVSDAIQPFHLLSSPSPPAFNLSQNWGLF